MSDDYDDYLRRQDWAALSRRLTEYAHAACKGASWELAEDLPKTVVTRLFDPSRRVWDRTNDRKKRSTMAEMAHPHATLERLRRESSLPEAGAPGQPPANLRRRRLRGAGPPLSAPRRGMVRTSR